MARSLFTRQNDVCASYRKLARVGTSPSGDPPKVVSKDPPQTLIHPSLQRTLPPLLRDQPLELDGQLLRGLGHRHDLVHLSMTSRPRFYKHRLLTDPGAPGMVPGMRKHGITLHWGCFQNVVVAVALS